MGSYLMCKEATQMELSHFWDCDLNINWNLVDSHCNIPYTNLCTIHQRNIDRTPEGDIYHSPCKSGNPFSQKPLQIYLSTSYQNQATHEHRLWLWLWWEDRGFLVKTIFFKKMLPHFFVNDDGQLDTKREYSGFALGAEWSSWKVFGYTWRCNIS